MLVPEACVHKGLFGLSVLLGTLAISQISAYRLYVALFKIYLNEVIDTCGL